MRFILDEKEKEMLKEENIPFYEDRDYSDEEALALLGQVYDVEIMYSNSASAGDGSYGKKAKDYARIADTIQRQIPE